MLWKKLPLILCVLKYILFRGDKMKEKIEKERESLNESIKKNGLHSEITRLVSLRMDKLINRYYHSPRLYPEWSDMYIRYRASIEKLRQISKEFGKFPSVKEWNHFVSDNPYYLSNTSMQYISSMDWNSIRNKINQDMY